ncbi:MAG: hypothetical protein WBI00_17875, partial [Thermoanaerobaculia bacterium]
HKVRAFGVDYCHIVPPEGGDLYVTHHGWPHVLQLLPKNWYVDRWYSSHGERLAGATGNVYRVHSKPVDGRSADLVVKFSRVAQEVSIVVETSFPADVDYETIAGARFNSPMEEFGLVYELRRDVLGAAHPRILVQKPLAIYAPPEEFKLWQLGRKQNWFKKHRRLLADDQEKEVKAIELDIKRIYVLLYGWIKGRDAEQYWEAGDITQQELYGLTVRVIRELAQKGFRVLDNKPKHFILRKQRRDRKIMRRDGRRLTYALVDFEFLQRTPEYQQEFKAAQRERYWQLQSAKADQAVTPSASNLEQVNIFGVDYIHGSVADGGKLWVVGRNPDLFDFFVADRWRRAPRVKLSPSTEVYHTRTRDNIHVVYRRSRVGSRPRVDPLTVNGKRIREHGYNSPFEEVVIAERLRQMGVSTTYARAVYRTGHRSTETGYLRDLRRYEEHDGLVTPGAFSEAILMPDYDYYTIWDYFRGCDPERGWKGGRWIDLEQAREQGLVTQNESQEVIGRTKDLFQGLDLEDDALDEHEFAVRLSDDGQVLRGDRGETDVTFGIDAMTAYETGLLDDSAYGRVISRLQGKLRAADCEKLDLEGSHLLLSLGITGRFNEDRDGELLVTLCNFEFVRGLYRPIR